MNNAGTQIHHDSIDFLLADFDEVWKINGRSVFQLCQGFGRPMLERGSGSIVNIASLMSFHGGLRVPAYTAAKGAVAHFTKSLCNEWAAQGVIVNAVAPGYVATDMNEALLHDPERFAQISARIPAVRWAEPKDIAGAVHFLCSPAASYIHGVVLPVDGGWLARSVKRHARGSLLSGQAPPRRRCSAGHPAAADGAADSKLGHRSGQDVTCSRGSPPKAPRL